MYARSLLFGVALLGGCEDDTKPPLDAPVIVPDVAVDAAVDAMVCTTSTECPCFTNYDCPSTHACTSQGEMVTCIPGPRGTGEAGTVCTTEADCKSALCVEDSMGGFRCSDVCETSATCPPELPRCLGGLGICAREP